MSIAAARWRCLFVLLLLSAFVLSVAKQVAKCDSPRAVGNNLLQTRQAAHRMRPKHHLPLIHGGDPLREAPQSQRHSRAGLKLLKLGRNRTTALMATKSVRRHATRKSSTRSESSRSASRDPLEEWELDYVKDDPPGKVEHHRISASIDWNTTSWNPTAYNMNHQLTPLGNETKEGQLSIVNASKNASSALAKPVLQPSGDDLKADIENLRRVVQAIAERQDRETQEEDLRADIKDLAQEVRAIAERQERKEHAKDHSRSRGANLTNGTAVVLGKKDRNSSRNISTAPLEPVDPDAGANTTVLNATAENLCATRDGPDPEKVNFWYTKSPPGTPCVFGVDQRDEGSHCITDDVEYGSYGWCFTSQKGDSWGNCNEECPLFGYNKVLATRIDDLTEEVKTLENMILMSMTEPPTESSVTEIPTEPPTVSPTQLITAHPTSAPFTSSPSGNDTVPQTELATKPPTESPIEMLPTELPTKSPTELPSELPTESPTQLITVHPTSMPTLSPTENKTVPPTELATKPPTESPTEAQTETPTESPTKLMQLITATPTPMPPSNSSPTETPTEIPNVSAGAELAPSNEAGNTSAMGDGGRDQYDRNKTVSNVSMVNDSGMLPTVPNISASLPVAPNTSTLSDLNLSLNKSLGKSTNPPHALNKSSMTANTSIESNASKALGSEALGDHPLEDKGSNNVSTTRSPRSMATPPEVEIGAQASNRDQFPKHTLKRPKKASPAAKSKISD